MNSSPEYQSVEQNIEGEEEEEEKKEEEEKLRNLAFKKETEVSGDYVFVLYENQNFLGKEAKATYVINLEDGKVENKIVVEAGGFELTVGNDDGIEKPKSGTKKGKDTRKKLLLGRFPIVAYEIKLDITLSMSLNAGVTIATNKFYITLSGTVDISAEITVGTVVRFTAGVKGTIINADFQCGFNTKTQSFLRSESYLKLSSCNVVGYLKGEVRGTGIKLVNEVLEIWKGWKSKDVLKYLKF